MKEKLCACLLDSNSEHKYSKCKSIFCRKYSVCMVCFPDSMSYIQQHFSGSETATEAQSVLPLLSAPTPEARCCEEMCRNPRALKLGAD